MDNCFTGRRDRSHQIAFARWCIVLPSCLDSMTTSFSFGAWRVWTCFHERHFFIFTMNSTFYFLLPSISTELSTILSSPGQKQGICGHVMASFDGHMKCARCRDKMVGEILSKSFNWPSPLTDNGRLKRRSWFRPPLLPLLWTIHT